MAELPKDEPDGKFGLFVEDHAMKPSTSPSGITSEEESLQEINVTC